MTLDQFKDRGVAAALPQGGAKSLDPVTLAVLTAALVGAAAQLASECVHQLFAKDARNPTFRQRARLRWHFVRPAVQKAIAETPCSQYVDAWHVGQLTANGLLGLAKQLTDPEFEALKAGARAWG